MIICVCMAASSEKNVGFLLILHMHSPVGVRRGRFIGFTSCMWMVPGAHPSSHFSRRYLFAGVTHTLCFLSLFFAVEWKLIADVLAMVVWSLLIETQMDPAQRRITLLFDHPASPFVESDVVSTMVSAKLLETNHCKVCVTMDRDPYLLCTLICRLYLAKISSWVRIKLGIVLTSTNMTFQGWNTWSNAIITRKASRS